MLISDRAGFAELAELSHAHSLNILSARLPFQAVEPKDGLQEPHLYPVCLWSAYSVGTPARNVRMAGVKEWRPQR